MLIQQITELCKSQQKKMETNQTKICETKSQLELQLDEFDKAKNKSEAVKTFEIYRQMKKGETQNRKIVVSSKEMKVEKIEVVFDKDSIFQKCLLSRASLFQLIDLMLYKI
ncbi:hypothetical protein Btru_006225 [Bulinus truncatus]|nr:hypothetical protein Btru_006225 [Bulinus truncatus]